MRTIPSNSIVAILSTSYLLSSTSSRTGNPPASADTTDDSRKDAWSAKNDTSSNIDNDLVDPDVFVAYERLRTATSRLALRHVSLEKGMQSPGSRADHLSGYSDGAAVREGKGLDGEGKRSSRSQQTNAREVAGLVVFASPQRFETTYRVERGCEGFLYDEEGIARSESARTRDGAHKPISNSEAEATTSEQEIVRELEAKSIGESKDTSTRSGILSYARPSSERREKNQAAPTSRLRDIAPMPFLMFDTHSFAVQGELDERFLFEGGVAEWLTRVRLWQTPSSKINSVDFACAGCPSIPKKQSPLRFKGTLVSDSNSSTAGISRIDEGAGSIVGVHGQGWAGIYLRPWPMNWCKYEENQNQHDGDGTSETFAASDVGLSSNIDAQYISTVNDTTNNGIPFEMARVEGPQKESSGDDGRRRRGGNAKPSKPTEIGSRLDQWSLLPPGQLEKLVETDADLFFLPWLLLQAAEGTTSACQTIKRDRKIRVATDKDNTGWITAAI